MTGIGELVSSRCTQTSRHEQIVGGLLPSLVGGLAGGIFGILALAWPDVTILVTALLVGPVAVINGARQVLRALRDREQLGLAASDQLHLHLAGTRLVIERPQDAISELRQVASAVPETRSLVEELLADRRAAATLE